MRSRSTAALAALMCVAAIGCDSSGTGPAGTVPSLPASTTSSASAAPTTTKTDEQVDYSRLLLQPGDLSDNEDTFTEQSRTPSGPDGLPGASALFVNQDDTRAISDTIVIYPDAETAANTLKAALPTIGSTVTGATTRPAPVGSNGTMAVGTSADGSKATTLLLFNEGPALVRLEFQSVPGDVTTDQFVINIGKMQQIALRTGLASAG
ncbi:hypothetical protein [Mycolicibacterium tusciae]|jgi:hypothetical protein|uniref:DUF5642 domain-containing protein n=1 Tax=Mycolicibacterium tusciae TaxID=75922 RepID=A0A1X0JKI8_9MYCO|nr:hypothetical protein [Mycolicibacterium tusciae]ORB63393.1 hypothetical protein BST47_19785 [Mycolicibacterium tusciae]